MPQSQLIEIPFPFSGINETEARRRQPDGTTPDALNVRPFDAATGYRRGSQRPGLSKFITNAVNGSNKIQAIDQATLILDPSTVIADIVLVDEDFSGYADGYLPELNATDWVDSYQNDGSAAAGDDEFNYIFGATKTDVVHVEDASDSVDSSVKRECAIHSDVSVGTTYLFRAEMDLVFDSTGSNELKTKFGFLFRLSDPVSDSQYYVMEIEVRDDSPWKVYWSLFSWNGTSRTQVGSAEFNVPGNSGTGVVYEWRMSGNTGTLYVNDVLATTQTGLTLYAANVAFGFGVGNTGNAPGSADDLDWDNNLNRFRVFTASPPASFRDTKIIVVSGGNVYTGTPISLALATNGTAAMDSVGDVNTTEAFQKTFLTDGTAINYQYLDYADTTVKDWWDALTAGQLPVGGTGTLYDITAVNQATPSFTVAEDLSAVLATDDFIQVAGSTDGNDGIYRVAGVAGAGPTVITVDEAIPDAGHTGDLREADRSCRWATLYRGRVVMWGLSTDPQNWFMSAVDDPFDWDYSPATLTETMAVAGNNSNAGLLGDVLNCCAAFSDDLMVMGGDHTLWVMRGDPASGGVIDNISRSTGIVGPYAYAWSPEGDFYFVGAGKLWRMPAGTTLPEAISRGRLDNFFASIDYSKNWVRMAYNTREQGVHIYFTQISQASAGSEPVHIWYDRRTDSLWKESYPASIGPTAMMVYDADDPDDRAVVLGGWDSKVRLVDTAVKDDDGTAVTSHVWMRQLLLSDQGRIKMTGIRAILGTGSDDVTIEGYADESAELVIAETAPRWTRTVSADRNNPIINRLVGNSVALKLVNTTTASNLRWTLESLTARLTLAGPQRQGNL